MKKYGTEIKWAFIFIAMMLLWMVMEKALGMHDERIEQHAMITNFVAIPAILIYVLALREKKKRHFGGSMTYKEGFYSGIIMTAVITLFVPLTQYITSAYITPDYFDNMIAHTVKQDLMTQEKAAAYFNMKSYIVQSLLFTPVMGIATTAIVMLFLRSRSKK